MISPRGAGVAQLSPRSHECGCSIIRGEETQTKSDPAFVKRSKCVSGSQSGELLHLGLIALVTRHDTLKNINITPAGITDRSGSRLSSHSEKSDGVNPSPPSRLCMPLQHRKSPSPRQEHTQSCPAAGAAGSPAKSHILPSDSQISLSQC